MMHPLSIPIKFYIHLSLIFILTQGVLAQNQQTVDSLLQVLETDVSDKKKVDTYNLIAREYSYTDSLTTAKYVNQAIELAEQISYPEGKINALSTIAWVIAVKGYPVDAEMRYKRIIQKADSMGYASGKARAYHKMGVCAIIQGRGKESLDYIKQSLEIYEKLGDQREIANTSNTLGATYRGQADYNKSLYYLKKSLKIYEALGPKSELARVLFNLSLVYGKEGNYKRQLDHILRALDISNELGDLVALHNTYYALGTFYKNQGEYDKALENFKSSLKISQNVNRGGMATSISQIGKIFLIQKDYEKANEYFIQFLELTKELANKTLSVSAYANLGDVHEAKGEYSTAMSYYEQALGIAEEIGALSTRNTLLISVGKIHMEEGKPLLAKKYLEEALRISQEIGDLKNIKEAAYQLSEVEQVLGNYQSAYDKHVLYKQYADSLFNEDQTKAIARLEAEYEYDQEKDSIAFANAQERLILNQTIDQQRNRQNLTLAGIGILFVIIFILYRFFQSRQRANKLLQLQRDEIEQQRNELASLDHAKSRFFANISHELRTPLTLISAPLEAALPKSAQMPSLQRDLKLMKANTNKLRSLVDDILELSKLEFDKVKENAQEVAIHSLLHRTADNFRSLAQSLGIRYELSLEGLPKDYLHLDPRMLEKVVNNMLSNSLKYTDEHGLVELKAERQEERLLIKVIDNGAGISEEDLPHIFNRYYQGKKPNTPFQQGTGIGLALAKEYTRLMGGDLTVESSLGKGSTFILQLPYVQASMPKEAEQQAVEAITESVDAYEPLLPILETGQTRKLHILVVEDHAEMQHFLKNLLASHYEVGIAFHGKQALNYLEEHSVDMIISDVMMPVMGGFELLKHVREHKRYQGIPVIMLTALNDEHYRLKALSIGVDDYLPKPFSPEELLARVGNMLARQNARKMMFEETDQEEAQTPIPEVDGNAKKGNKTFIQQLEELILAELENEEFHLDDVASAFNLGESQFRRRVKKITGLTPKKYQREVALQKARRLIEEGVYDNLTAVAFSAGIRNATRFSEYYEQRFGINPRIYFHQ
ncbi:MAG: tetratricopeptide repeat protein [Bacteroidota bacterium]